MATAIGARPIDQAIRAIPAAWFRPDARVYWIDLAGSAALGWSGFALGVVAHRPSIRAAGLIVAAFALYRAVLFIHELTHLAAHELRAFRVVWNVVVGVPLLLPSFLYEGVHTDHHRQRSYGTAHDPEYVPFAWQPPGQIAVYGIASIFVPIALAIRFGIVAPLSWIVPPLRLATRERLSALVINHRYVRRAPLGTAALIEEAAATAFVWSAFALWLAGRLPGRVIVCWFGVSAAASLVNAMRTLAAHRYDYHAGAGVTRDERSDSMTEHTTGFRRCRITISAARIACSRRRSAPTTLT